MDEFQRELTASQWVEWLEFFDLEPSGNFADDVNWGQLLALLENANRARGPAAQPEDWRPGLRELRAQRQPDTPEMQSAAWRAAAAASGNQSAAAGSVGSGSGRGQ